MSRIIGQTPDNAIDHEVVLVKDGGIHLEKLFDTLYTLAAKRSLVAGHSIEKRTEDLSEGTTEGQIQC